MAKVKLTVTRSACRSGYHREGDRFVVEDLCPPLCHELWSAAYPYVYALQNGALIDGRRSFDVKCPDGGRVWLHGEPLEEDRSGEPEQAD